LTHWRAPAKAATLNEDNFVPELWRWLQAVTTHREPGPDLYVGYGLDEQLAVPDSLLAAALPQDHVFTTPGAHNWQTWNHLIDRFLDEGPLATRCR
jgi:S-formylglutathione hydrolase FrmB